MDIVYKNTGGSGSTPQLTLESGNWIFAGLRYVPYRAELGKFSYAHINQDPGVIMIIISNEDINGHFYSFTGVDRIIINGKKFEISSDQPWTWTDSADPAIPARLIHA